MLSWVENFHLKSKLGVITSEDILCIWNQSPADHSNMEQQGLSTARVESREKRCQSKMRSIQYGYMGSFFCLHRVSTKAEPCLCASSVSLSINIYFISSNNLIHGISYLGDKTATEKEKVTCNSDLYR